MECHHQRICWKEQCEKVIRFYYQMQQEEIKPKNFTFPIFLKTCDGLSTLQEGKEIHHHIIRNGFESNVYVCTTLVDMYSKCDYVEATKSLTKRLKGM